MPMMSLKDAFEQAQSLHDQGSYRSALKQAEILYKQKPQHPPVIALYISCLQRVQQFDHGVRIAKRALRNISHKPHRVMIISHLCDGMTQSGNLDEAIEMVRDELESQPDNKPLLGALGHMLVMRDRHDEVVQLVEDHRSKGIETLHLAAVYGRALMRSDRRAEAIEYIQKLLETNSDESDISKHLAYNALGQLLDKEKRYDEAMSAFKSCKQLLEPAFDEKRLDFTLKTVRETWTPERFSLAEQRPAPSGPTPIFVVGMPRSGTTLTEQIIDAHHRGYGAGELGMLNDIVRELAKDPENMYGTGPEEYDPAALAEATSAYRQYIRELAGERDVDVIVDKAPLNCLFLGFIALAFPDARIIHCKRDPRDNCLSCFFQLLNAGHSYSFDLHNCGRYYRHYSGMMDHYRKLLASPQVAMPIFENDYEGMVGDQEKRTRELLEFIGLPFDPACLEFHSSGRVAVTLSNDQVRQPIYTSSTKRYENYTEHLRPLIEGLGEVLSD